MCAGENPENEMEERAEYVRNFENRDALFREVSRRMRSASERKKGYRNPKRRVAIFPEGAQVLRKHFTLSDASRGYTAKLAPRWIGRSTR